MNRAPANHENHGELEPSAWVRRFAPLVAQGARVLDVAAGRGRHARFFAARNTQVTAVDRDAEALAALRGVSGVTIRVADLEDNAWPFAGDSFDAIVVVNYLHRPLWSALLPAIAPDGVLIYETFAVGNERFGRPSNPAFLLRAGELLALVREQLVIVAFEQGEVAGNRRTVVQRIAAVGRARPWPPRLPA